MIDDLWNLRDSDALLWWNILGVHSMPNVPQKDTVSDKTNDKSAVPVLYRVEGPGAFQVVARGVGAPKYAMLNVCDIVFSNLT